ncbi:hypothetical protein COLU111180_04300 [Cohnella lubricantis]|uniref:Uncharacterized protein n=1 Tax=Cohnella lubricantis TaxID=2163172 RepID=A0A841T6F7_9BACL|nr:hypothetical protein [Cohnella lubricantis]MBB6676472.1 hypothetical protein [Cohnella lubricantis]MBP2117089.1 hypothetical protein [Cohnella lubricantis]
MSDIEFPDEFGQPLLRSGIADHVWRLKETDPEAFRAKVIAYFALCYPGWRVVRAQYPTIYLQDERGQKA